MKEHQSLTGHKISHYRILETLGGGGMGVVYKAEDTRLHRLVALKFLSDESAHDPGSLEGFQHEAEAASALNHANICTIYDIDKQREYTFIAMEFLDGKVLKDCIAHRPLPLARVLDLGIQIADGLDAAHQLGILHRDIKPANIFVTKRGDAKILDFGLAKLAAKSVGETTLTHLDPVAGPTEVYLTRPGTVMGTVAYMSPEQVRGEELDLRTDIFSVGIVLYEMATGQPAFQGNTSAVVTEAILNRAPVSLHRLITYDGLELERIVNKALQKDRRLRYQTAADLRADLQAYKNEVTATHSSGLKVYSKSSLFLRKLLGISSETRRPRWKQFLTAAAALVRPGAPHLGDHLLGGLGGIYWQATHAAILTDKDTVVLADFTNTTGDSVFDGTLRQGLAAQLEQSPFLALISDDRIAEVLPLKGKPKDARLSHQLARDICRRTGGKATIEGFISGLAKRYELKLQVVDCTTEDVLTTISEEAVNREQVIRVLGDTAARMRKKLGESLPSVQKYNVPAENVTTSSLTDSARFKSIRVETAPPIAVLPRGESIASAFALLPAW